MRDMLIAVAATATRADMVLAFMAHPLVARMELMLTAPAARSVKLGGLDVSLTARKVDRLTTGHRTRGVEPPIAVQKLFIAGKASTLHGIPEPLGIKLPDLLHG